MNIFISAQCIVLIYSIPHKWNWVYLSCYFKLKWGNLWVSFRFSRWKHMLLFRPWVSHKKIWSMQSFSFFSPCKWYWFVSTDEKQKFFGDWFKSIIGLKSGHLYFFWSSSSASEGSLPTLSPLTYGQLLLTFSDGSLFHF